MRGAARTYVGLASRVWAPTERRAASPRDIYHNVYQVATTKSAVTVEMAAALGKPPARLLS